MVKTLLTALGKLRTEKKMIKEIKQASVPPKLAHSYDFGEIDLVPDAAVGGKLHESNYIKSLSYRLLIVSNHKSFRFLTLTG
jgi:hypothetical protein